MMNINKKYIKTLFIPLFIGSFFLMGGCQKYLGVSPDNRIRPSSVEDYQEIVTGAYPMVRSIFTDLMTDDYKYYDYRSYNNANIESWLLPFYLWSDQLTHNFPRHSWTGYYNSIYKANVVLEGIDEVDGDDDLKRSVKGEALLIRAYAHFMLVNMFALAYDPQTASSEMGVAYVTETEEENIKYYKRNTIQEVYDRAEQDAQKGLKLIDDSKMEVPQFHWSKASAHAFLSRLYLYEEEWYKAIRESKLVLEKNSTVRTLIKDQQAYFPSGLYNEFAADYFSTNHKNILLMSYTLEWNSFYRSGFYANEFRDQFDPDDYRGKIYTKTSNQFPNYWVRKFRSLRPSDGQQYSTVEMFSVEEVMLNAAEASVRKDPPNMEYTVELLNDILKHRYDPFTPLKVSDFSGPDDLLDRVLEERRKELCYEGNRWFDVKRLKIPIKHEVNGRTVTLSPDDPRRAIQIPTIELNANPLMEPNPR